MPTSLVIAIYNNEYLFVETGKYWREDKKAPLQLQTKIGELTREEAERRLLEQLPEEVDNKNAQMQSPIVVRSPSGEHETWKSRVYVPSGIWGFVKGECNPGEPPLACAQREFTEETNVPIDQSRFKKLVFGNRDINIYKLDLNEIEKDEISESIQNSIRDRIGEVFNYRWSTLGAITGRFTFNNQSQVVLDRLTIKPPPPKASADKNIYGYGRGGKTRRRKNGKRRRQTKKHI